MQTPIRCVPGVISGYKRLRRELNHSLPSILFLFQKVQTISEVNPVSCLMVTEGSFTDSKVTGGESDHSPPSRVEIKNKWAHIFDGFISKLQHSN
jgi:hypothetical protein